LEDKRKNLAMRPDFCLREIFGFIDLGSTGYVNLNDLSTWSRNSNINLSREDWASIMDRFDKDRDGYLSVSEFSVLFMPLIKTYKSSMVNR